MATELEEAAGVKISTLCHHGNRTGRSCRSEDQYTLSPWQQNWKKCQSKDQYTLSPWQQNWKKLPDRRSVHFVTMATEQEEAAGQKISTLCHHGNRTGRGCRTED
ncbi:hypothetical protein RRG08_063082 [Elysia crispata]|uniref:Uncharacterized protein n=1 Tax=Elysia crispata TaxID=231223 RepID=A0AAE0Y5U7_9GAST|nr:hypothetical protein RRG08_063082 [Elysia crispata]